MIERVHLGEDHDITSSSVRSVIDDTRRAIGRALSDPPLAEVVAALDRLGLGNECDRLVAAVTVQNGLRESLRAVRAKVASEAFSADATFERVVLLRQFDKSLVHVPSLPVSDDVKRLFCDECRCIITPPKQAGFGRMSASFVAFCELSTFRRFPAGQFHWMVSGLPRSWILKVTGRERLTLLYWIVRKLKGFGPAFVPHLNAYRRNRWLVESEANRSYYRMAQALLLQPHVKGLVASSWLRSPETLRVSPELAWVNKAILENGGLVVTMGPADPEGGVLARSSVRKALYESGQFKPTIGLAVWPRDAMLAWAARHPELGAARPRATGGISISTAEE